MAETLRERIAKRGQARFGYLDWKHEWPTQRDAWLQLADWAITAVADAVEYQPIVGSMDISTWLREQAGEG